MSFLIGKVLLHYLKRPKDADIITFTSLGEKDVLPVSYLFRDLEAMPELEIKALDLAKGSILDVGAGAGSHSLILQDRGFDVTALDRSPEAVVCCQKRGVQKAVHSELLDYNGSNFDTILLLMNGIGIAGSLSQLEPHLLHLKKLLKPGGQILLDSSDIRYMFDCDKNGEFIDPKISGYYGDVHFALYFEGEYEPSFPWLYVDYKTLEGVADRCGLRTEKVLDGPHFDYLARLTLI